MGGGGGHTIHMPAWAMIAVPVIFSPSVNEVERFRRTRLLEG